MEINPSCADIFELELEAWIADPDVWPEDRSYKMFTEWFDVKVSDTFVDLGFDALEVEDF